MNPKNLVLFAFIFFVPQLLPAQGANQSQAEQRNQLWTEAKKARQNEDFSEAAKLGEQLFQLEQEESNEKLITSLNWLAEVYQQQELWQKAIDRLQLAASFSIKIHGDRDWRAIDASLKVGHLKQLSILTQAEREELERANELYQQCASESKTDIASAIEIATSASNIQKKILGEQHPDYVKTLNELASFY